MVRVKISTTVTLEQFKFVKDNRYRWCDLVSRGIIALDKTKPEEDILILQENLKKALLKLTQTSARTYLLEEKIIKLKEYLPPNQLQLIGQDN